MMGIGYIINLTQKGQVAMGRIQQIFSSKSDVADNEKTDQSIKVFKGEIEFRKLNFIYPNTNKPSLQNIDLKIPSGQILAVVGVIGSGKSTLAQLIPRLYEVTENTLLIGGHPIHKIPLSILRKNIGYVDQEPYLFSATIRENIIFGNSEASKDDVNDVVKKSGLLADLNRFPKGLETVVGERGISLSGGQIQRIAIARALLIKPNILVLDDAFSSLDAETEDNILSSIRDFTTGATTVMVSHRLSAVCKADRIIVINNGRIIEDGTHSELIRLNGEYAQTYKNQSLAMEMEITLQ
jgi:ATP-binding cassette subfamily B protein